ncbi:hypothetical protein HETIRDRAFT_436865 [Heterobasidion irregulare TC 32-1]|uniref:D-lactate dehydratase n=1 Tax=Heterobasidion irregulare (strain TC 32-1) TaxID=747525 RepID=W4JQV7_HETIT|nr:uncharacterized protein HETIRDRAFT_436865 [Heterobasidion irregulare TC 32-1]ETW75947.1 hypothetical protein HETIRDRAFT_436865 [Heterobasidion irregulare TC 32-1]
MVSALILLADGTEEMEFTIIYDTLVRAGIICTSAFVPSDASAADTDARISPPFAKGSRGIRIQPDTYFSLQALRVEKFGAIIIPGGAQGARTMAESPAVQRLVREFYEQKKIVGMICAGSMAALTSKLPKQPLTSHPSVKSKLETEYDYREDSVVVSGNLITSRGPGTAFPFALTLIEHLCGATKREEVQGPMMFPPETTW